LDPRPFSFHQLVMMRKGCENENWDRLAYEMSILVTMNGNKNVDMNKFHKFKQQVDQSITRDELKNLKHFF